MVKVDQPALFDVTQVPKARVQRRIPPPKDAADQAREFGAWTLDKLSVLELYLKMYRRVAGGGNYIDAFAGDGRVKVGGEVVPGSAAIALASGAFKRLDLFELPSMAIKLENNLQSKQHFDRCHIHPGDSNITIGQALATGEIDPARPCFAFLDPNSTQLRWSTVETLSTFKTVDPNSKQCKVELWILFNLEQAIRRLWPTRTRSKYPLPPHAETLDDIMGSRDAWIDLWDQYSRPSHLLARYCDRLRALGYTFVTPQLVNDPKTGQAQYWMIHASDHDAAWSFMRWAKRSSNYTPATIPLFSGFEPAPAPY